MRHPRYCLTHHPDIFSSITNVTHFSTPPMPPTLVHRSLYPRWRITNACTSPQHVAYVTHANNITHTGTSPTLARHQNKRTTHASTPPTHACHQRNPRQYKQHAISETPLYPMGQGRFETQVPAAQVPRARCAGVRFQVSGEQVSSARCAGSRCQVPGSQISGAGFQVPTLKSQRFAKF